jgi:hypothetical protein
VTASGASSMTSATVACCQVGAALPAARLGAVMLELAIGSQGRGAIAGPVPHPPFNPYVPFSAIRLTDGLLDMVTLPLGNG